MTFLQIEWIFLGCLLVPSSALIASIFCWRWRLDRRHERSPISEKLLRPAGESLRVEIENLNEAFLTRCALTILVPAVMMAALLLSDKDGAVTTSRAIIAFVLCAVLTLIFAARFFASAKALRDCRLGFHGERAVAEEINQLLREGCRVFHDVPIEPYGNIDHVIVSAAGVFAIETKARRKRRAPKGKQSHVADFDGKVVRFPTWTEVEMVDQARMQADRLRNYLTSAVGEPVAVQPILTLPGWFVSTSVPLSTGSAVRVLNPRGIAHLAVPSRQHPALSPTLIQRIVHQLEQKCRDVEI